jgi:hypothetical protein
LHELERRQHGLGESFAAVFPKRLQLLANVAICNIVVAVTEAVSRVVTP